MMIDPPPFGFGHRGDFFLVSGNASRLNNLITRVQCDVSLVSPVELKQQSV
jgi:hypothetical protein